MSKKSQRDMGDAFGSFMNESAADASNRILNVPEAPTEFGSVNSDKIRYIDIFSIEPDPMQPRRAIPHELRADWQIQAQNIREFLHRWTDATGINISYWLEYTGDGDRPEPDTPAQAALMALIDFAASIRRDGLQNAITVVSTGAERYGIETGERRWLAYHVLHYIYGDEYRTIPARQMQQRDVWRQATENNARENLNAIARARQLAILLMDLHGVLNFRPLSDFAHEQDFYAQVADSDAWRIPDGTTPQLLNAMGFGQSDQLRKYRALLRLPREAWDIADDKNIPERPLRDMQSKAGDDAALIIALVKNYGASDSPAPAKSTPPASSSRWYDHLAQHSSRSTAFWQKAKSSVDKLSPEARLQLRTAAEQERALLDELLARLDDSSRKKQ